MLPHITINNNYLNNYIALHKKCKDKGEDKAKGDADKEIEARGLRSSLKRVSFQKPSPRQIKKEVREKYAYLLDFLEINDIYLME